MLATVLTVLVSLCAPATEADPSDEGAERHASVMRSAEQLWEQGNDEGVLALFEGAYAIDPRPIYLFGQGRAAAALGRCEIAVERLEAFVATNPPPEQTAAARAELDKCPEGEAPPEPVAPPAVLPPDDASAVEGSAATTPTDPPPQDAASPPDEPSRRDAPRRRSRSLDRVALGLGTGGGILAIAGASALGVGAARVQRPQASTDEEDYAARVRSGRTLTATGAALLSVGGALVVAGVVKYLVGRRRLSAGGTAAALGFRPMTWSSLRGR